MLYSTPHTPEYAHLTIHTEPLTYLIFLYIIAMNIQPYKAFVLFNAPLRSHTFVVWSECATLY